MRCRGRVAQQAVSRGKTPSLHSPRYPGRHLGRTGPLHKMLDCMSKSFFLSSVALFWTYCCTFQPLLNVMLRGAWGYCQALLSLLDVPAPGGLEGGVHMFSGPERGEFRTCLGRWQSGPGVHEAPGPWSNVSLSHKTSRCKTQIQR